MDLITFILLSGRNIPINKYHSKSSQLTLLRQAELHTLQLLPEQFVGLLVLVLDYLELRGALPVLQDYFLSAVAVISQLEIWLLCCRQEGHLVFLVIEMEGTQPSVQFETCRPCLTLE